jgi:hypothetical protein
VPFWILAVPYSRQLADPEGLGQPQKRLAEFAERSRIGFIDLLPVFSGMRELKMRPLFRDANHFSIRGHHAVAKLMAEQMLGPIAAVADADPAREERAAEDMRD